MGEEESQSTQAFIRSQGSSGVDINNLEDLPKGIRNKKKSMREDLKNPIINFVIFIPDDKNTKLQDAPHVEAQHTTPDGKEYFTVYLNYLYEAFNTNKFLLCQESLKLFAVKSNVATSTNLFTSDVPIDLNKLYQFLYHVVQNKSKNKTTRRQLAMDFEEGSGANRPTGYSGYRPRGLNEDWNFGHNGSSTPFRWLNLEQLNQTLLKLSMQNQIAIKQLVEMQISQKEAFTSMAEAAKKRAYDSDFTAIPVFNRRDKSKFHKWFRKIEYTCTYSK